MPESVWDPFEGETPRERDEFRAFPVGKWQRKHKAAGMLGLVGLVLWIALPFVGLTIVNWLGFVAAMGSGFWIALTLDTDFPGDDGAKEIINPLQRTAAKVAERSDWGLSLIQPATAMTFPRGKELGQLPLDQLRKLAEAAMRKKGRQRLLSERQLSDLSRLDLQKTFQKSPQFLLVDRRIYPLTQDVPSMVRPSPVVAMPLHVQAIFHWQREAVPFWTGVGAFKGDVRHPNIQGGRDFRKPVHTLVAVFAFPLSRNTGLDISLRAAFPFLQRCDPQLDGQTFNRTYHIQVVEGDQQALYRLLTPAAQTKLLDLFAANGAEMVVRGNVVFVRALFTVLMSEEDAAASLAADEWHAKLTAFADELLLLKRYLE